MVEIVFQRKYKIDKDSFSEETRKKFSFANEYFEVLLNENKGESKDINNFILKLTKRQNFKEEYNKLNEKEKGFDLYDYTTKTGINKKEICLKCSFQ